jgi:hypothetical protein
MKPDAAIGKIRNAASLTSDYRADWPLDPTGRHYMDLHVGMLTWNFDEGHENWWVVLPSGQRLAVHFLQRHVALLARTVFQVKLDGQFLRNKANESALTDTVALPEGVIRSSVERLIDRLAAVAARSLIKAKSDHETAKRQSVIAARERDVAQKAKAKAELEAMVARANAGVPPATKPRSIIEPIWPAATDRKSVKSQARKGPPKRTS